MRLVTAKLVGSGLGFYQASVYLSKPGAERITYSWNSSDGWVGAATMRFPAPPGAGAWSVSGYGYGEVALCENGHIIFAYGGAGTRSPIPLTVSGSTSFLPSLICRAEACAPAPPTTTPTATSTPTATATRRATATPRPGYIALDGYVIESGPGGQGVPGVEIEMRIEGEVQPSVTTEPDGFYTTPLFHLPRYDMTWTARPLKPGYRFEPSVASGEGRMWSHTERVSFEAVRSTPRPAR